MDLKAAAADARDGAILSVPAGVYSVNLDLRRTLTLVGMPGAILDGGGKGPVIRVRGSGVSVSLRGLTLQHGKAQSGGAVCFEQGARLEILDCVLCDNAAHRYGGGAVYAAGEALSIARSRLERNLARQGGAVLLDVEVEAELASCLIAQNAAVMGGGLRLKEGSRAHLVGCTVADNRVKGPHSGGSCLYLSGTTSRQPRLELANCIVADADQGRAALFNAGIHPGAVAIDHCLLPPALEGTPGVDGTNRFGNPGFQGRGERPYALAASSKAAGAGSPYAYERVTSDLAGRPRLQAGTADAGAYCRG